MHWSELPSDDQIFTYFEEGSGLERTFAASALRRLCAQKDSELAGVTWALVALEPAHGAVLASKRGLEHARLERALQTPRYAPLLFCIMGEGTSEPSHLLVDGSHSYFAMLLRGQRSARAYIVPECLWRGFLVEGLPATSPEELLATPSWQGRARR